MTRLQWDAQAIHALGARAVYELLAEIGARTDLEIVADVVARFAAIDAATLRYLGGDKFPPTPIRRVA